MEKFNLLVSVKLAMKETNVKPVLLVTLGYPRTPDSSVRIKNIAYSSSFL